MNDQEQVLKAKVKILCACGRSADVKLALKVSLDYPCHRARPNPFSGAVSSLVDTSTVGVVDAVGDCADTQIDSQHVDGNVMSLIGEDELDALVVAAPPVAAPEPPRATSTTTTVANVATAVAETLVATSVESTESNAKRQKRE